MTKKPVKKKSQKPRLRHTKEAHSVVDSISSKTNLEGLLTSDIEPVGTVQAIKTVFTEDGKI